MTIRSKTITRVDLCDAVYRKVGLSRAASAEFVGLVLKEVAEAIALGESVKLSGFGTFRVGKKGQRLGRNPKTGVQVPIAPRRVVKFKASAIMKAQINSTPPVRGRTDLSEAEFSSE